MRGCLGVIVIAALTFLLGCTKEDPQPEIRDPIYSDLAKSAKAYGEQIKTLTEQVNGLKESLRKAEPNSLDRKDIQKELSSQQKRLRQVEQLHTYYNIRAERRRLIARLAYKEAFHAGRGDSWPDPSEYQSFQAMNRLRSANPNWNSRVPKLSDRLPSSKSEGKPKEQPKESEE